MRIFGFDCLTPKLSQDVNPLSGVLSWKPLTSTCGSPSHRFQHTICRSGKYLYMFGGRGTRGTQQDIWRYDIDLHGWNEVETTGCKPPSLEGHTVVIHEGKQYYFGGEMSFASAGEIPLWIFDPKTSEWTKRSKSNYLQPSARREHIAVVYDNQMYIHGGYIDLKGPSSEMWTYAFDANTWQPVKYTEQENCPTARYKHAACVYENYMWVCGGLSGITDRNEMQVWTWDFYSYTWCHIRTRSAPWQLYNHALFLVSGTVYVFGGSKEDGDACSKLWKIALNENAWTSATQIWHTCQFLDKIRPSPSANHCLIALPDIPNRTSNEKKVFSNVKNFMPLLSSKPKQEKTAIVPINPPYISEKIIIPKPSCHKQSLASTNEDAAGDNISPSPENCELETSLNDVIADDGLFLEEDYFSTDEVIKLERKNSKTRLFNSSYLNHSSSVSDKVLLLDSAKQERKDTKMGLNNSAFVNHFSGNDYKSNLVGSEKVRRFSYNLSEGKKTWQPKHEADGKFQSTSFIEVTPCEGKTVSRYSYEVNMNENESQKSEDHDEFVIKNDQEFTKDQCKEQTKLESIKLQSDIGLTRLLLIGGKLGNSSLNIDRPISMWQCQLCGNL